MSEDLGVAYGTVIINTAGALASLAALRAQTRSGVEALNTIGRSAIRAGVGLMGFGAVIVAAFAVAVSKTAELEKKMSFIKGITNMSKEQIDLVREKALMLGQSSAFTATQVADGFIELSKAGATSTQILGGMGDAMITLGQSADIALDVAAQTLISIRSQFGLLPKDSAHIADIVQGAANASIISVQDMIITMKYAGGIAHILGLSLEETAAAIAMVGNAGIKGSTAGTSLRRIFMQLSPHTKKATTAMEKLGIITKDGTNRFYDAAGGAKKLSEISEILYQSTKNLSKKDKKDYLSAIFLDRATPTAIALAEGGAKSFDKFYKAVTNTKAADVARERLNNLAGAWRIFKGSVETAMVRIGTPAQVPLMHLVQNLTKLVRAFANLKPQTQQFIVKTLLLVAAISMATGAFLIFFGTILRVIAIIKELQIFLLFVKGLFLSFTGAATIGSGIAALFTPVVVVVLAVVAAVAALIAIFVAAYKNSAPLRKAISDMHDTLMKQLAPAIKWVKGAWKSLVEEFKKFTGGVGNRTAKGIIVFADSLVALIEGFNGVKSKQGGVVGFFNKIGVVLKKAWVVIAKVFTAVKNAISDFIGGFNGNLVYNNGVLSFFSIMGEKVREFYDKVVVKLKQGLQGFKDAVTSFVDGFTGKATGKDGPLGFFEQLGEKVRWFKDEVVVKIKAAFSGIKDAVEAFVAGFTGNATGKDGPIGFFERLGTAARQFNDDVVVKLKEALTGIKDAVTVFVEAFKTGKTTGKDGPIGFFERLGAGVKWFNDNVVLKVQEAFTAIKTALADFMEAFSFGKTEGKDSPRNFFQALGDKVKWFKEVVPPMVAEAFNQIKIALADFLEAFTSGKTEGKDSPRNFFQNLGDKIRWFKETVVGWAIDGFTGIKDAWFAFEDGISAESTGKNGFLGLLEKIGVAIRWLKDNTLPILQGVVTTFQEAIDGFSIGFNDLDTSTEGIGTPFKHLGEILRPAIDLLKETWRVVKEQLWPAIEDLGAVFTDTLGPAMEDLWAVIQEELWPALQNLWKVIREELWPAIKLFVEETKPLWEVLGALAGIILGVLVYALVALANIIVWVLTLLAKFIGTILETIINVVKPILNGIISIISGAIDIITGIIQVFSSLFTGDWQGLWEGITLIVSGAWDAIAALFTAAWDVLYAIVEGIVKMIIDFFTTLYDELVGHSIIPDLINAIVEWFTSLPGKLLGLLGDFFSAAWDLGQAIVGGIMEGVNALPGLIWNALSGALGSITGFVSDAWNAAWEFGDGLWQGFKQGMGINSPSFIEKALYQVTDTTHTQLGLTAADVGQFNALGQGLKYPLPPKSIIPGIKVPAPPNPPIPMPARVLGNPEWAALHPYAVEQDRKKKGLNTSPSSFTSSSFGSGGSNIELKGILLQITLMANMIQTMALASQDAKLARGLNTASMQTITGQVVALAGLSMRLATSSQANITLSGSSLQSLREIERMTAINGLKPVAPVAPRPVIFSIGTVQDGDSLLRRARATDRMLSLAEGGDSSQQQGLGI